MTGIQNEPKPMPRTMPKHIKRFGVYKKIHQDIYRHNKNCTLIVVGQTGSGKSYVAQRIAYDLDPTFTIEERVVYTAEQFLNLLASKKLSRGKVIIFDEIVHEEGGDSRSSLSKSNKILSYVASTYRTLGLIVIFVLPSLLQLDKNLRTISVTAVIRTHSIDFRRGLCRVKFWWNDLNPMFGKAYLKSTHLTVDGVNKKVKYYLFAKPPKHFIEAYEIKKKNFVLGKLQDWSRTLGKEDLLVRAKTMKELVSEIAKDKNKFYINGVVSSEKIMSEFNIGRNKADSIARLIRLSPPQT